MPKAVKVKRYKSIYRRRSPLAVFLRTVCLAAVVGLLGFIGWNAYGPIWEYLDNIASDRQHSSSSSVPAPVSSSSEAPEESPSSSEPEVPPAVTLDAAVKGAYLPVSDLLDSERLAARLSAFREEDYNAVLIDLKDENGSLLYRSARGVAPSEEGVEQYDLEAACTQIRAAGMVPIGRMHAFRDHTASLTDVDMAVQYLDTGGHWLDNSLESGGQPWLNPYSEQARAYLAGLVQEAVSMGVGQILLDSVTFPVGYGLDLATYGETGGLSRSEVLAAFVRQVSDAAAAAGGEVSLYVSAVDALTSPDNFGGDPLALSDRVTLDVSPSLFGEGFSQGSFSVEQPMSDPGRTTDLLLTALSGRLPGSTAALIQDPNGSPAMVQSVTDALKEKGVESYLICQPN